MRVFWTPGCHVLLAICLVGLAASATRADETDAAADEARARAVLQASLDRIAAARALRFRLRTEFDVLQGSGELLEFGDDRTVTLRRPDRMRVDVVRRDGDRILLTYDGRSGVLHSPDQQAYAKVELGASVDDALDRLTGELGVPFPLAELLRSDVASSVPSLLDSALYVGPETLDGVECEHLAFGGAQADLQVWIRSSGSGLPHRIVITYRTQGRPQFRADFVEWSLEPEVPDALFAFAPPEGSRQLDVARLSGPEEDGD